MAIHHNQKVAILGLLEKHVAPQKSVIFLTTRESKESIKSDMNFQLRKSARTKGIALKVVKNTLLSLVFSSLPNLVGPTYVAYLVDPSSSDEITTPKAVVPILDAEFKDSLSIVGSIVNGEFYDSQKTVLLSKTPTKEQSFAQLAGLLNQITARIAIGINQVPTSVARGVSEAAKTLS